MRCGCQAKRSVSTRPVGGRPALQQSTAEDPRNRPSASLLSMNPPANKTRRVLLEARFITPPQRWLVSRVGDSQLTTVGTQKQPRIPQRSIVLTRSPRHEVRQAHYAL